MKVLAGEIAVTRSWWCCPVTVTRPGIVIDDEPSIGPAEVGTCRGLAKETPVSTGCLTGVELMADAFRRAGVEQHVGPVDCPDGSAALVFTGNLFYLLSTGVALPEAVGRAAAFDPECARFRLA